MRVINKLVAIVAFIIMYIPIFVIALLSFNESSTSTVFTGVSLKWYFEIFNDALLLDAITNTLIVSIISTFFSVIIGTLTAIGIGALNKSKRVRLMILNNVPVINPDIVTGISLLLLFSFIPLSFGISTVIIAHIFFSIPFVVLTVLPKVKELDPNLFDAARDLGCNRFEAIYKIIIPSIKMSIIAGALIAFTMSIDDFVITYFVRGNGYQNVSIWLYSRMGRKTFSPAIYAYNTLLISITIGVLLFVNKRQRRQKIK